MSEASTELEILRRILAPIVRYMLRKGVNIQNFIEVTKRVFVDVARDELLQSTSKVNASRLSMVTGIPRQDVTRISKAAALPPAATESLLSRVINRWRQDPTYLTKGKTPRVLSCDGSESEFQSLVTSVNKHVKPGTVLFELKRSGAVTKTSQGLKLIRPPERPPEEWVGPITALAEDIDTLIHAVDQNVVNPEKARNLHLRTEYDNIIKVKIPEVCDWLQKEGRKFHGQAREFLAKRDHDVNPAQDEEGGGHIVVTIFTYASDTPPIHEESA